MSRSLYRERGLKYVTQLVRCKVWQSLPLPGAWIEIVCPLVIMFESIVAPFTGSVD